MRFNGIFNEPLRINLNFYSKENENLMNNYIALI